MSVNMACDILWIIMAWYLPIFVFLVVTHKSAISK